MARRTVEQTELEITKLTQKLERVFNNSINAFISAINELTPSQKQQAILRLPLVLESFPDYQASLAGLEVIYGKELRSALDSVGRTLGKRISATDEDLQVASDVVDIEKTAVKTQIDAHTNDLQRTLYSATVSPVFVTVDDFRAVQTERVFRNVETELRTSVMSYNRTMNVKKAVEFGINFFAYRGPDDNITRPFCDYLLGDAAALSRDPKASINAPARRSAIYTLDEIRTMRNGQGLPVMQSGGGYNCRHTWNGISDDRAKQLGYTP